MKKIPSPILIFFFLTVVAKSAIIEGQNIKGCAKYFTNDYDEVRCIRCNVGMGLTQTNTCQFCKARESVVGVICKKNSPVLAVASLKNESDTKINEISSNKSLSRDSLQQNSSNTGPEPEKTKEITNNTNQNTASDPSFDFYSLGGVEDQVVSEYNITNCLKFNAGFSKCLVCQPKYIVQNSGQCISNPNIQQYSQITQNQSGQDKINTNSTKATQQPALDNTTITNNVATKISSNQINTEVKSVSSEKTTTLNVTPAHKYPNYPYCFDYDSGRCWACVSGYLLNNIIAKCVPYEKPPQPIIPSDTQNAAPQDPSSEPVVINAFDNCNLFNDETQICEQCVRNYYLNKNSSSCEVVDQSCRTYDKDTGLCLTCYVKYTLTKEGKCVAV